jgi:hypothetical protein
MRASFVKFINRYIEAKWSGTVRQRLFALLRSWNEPNAVEALCAHLNPAQMIPVSAHAVDAPRTSFRVSLRRKRDEAEPPAVETQTDNQPRAVATAIQTDQLPVEDFMVVPRQQENINEGNRVQVFDQITPAESLALILQRPTEIADTKENQDITIYDNPRPAKECVPMTQINYSQVNSCATNDMSQTYINVDASQTTSVHYHQNIFIVNNLLDQRTAVDFHPNFITAQYQNEPINYSSVPSLEDAPVVEEVEESQEVAPSAAEEVVIIENPNDEATSNPQHVSSYPVSLEQPPSSHNPTPPPRVNRKRPRHIAFNAENFPPGSTFSFDLYSALTGSRHLTGTISDSSQGNTLIIILPNGDEVEIPAPGENIMAYHHESSLRRRSE